MTPMKNLIARLFRDAKPLDRNPIIDALRAEPDGAARPLVECQIVLRGGYMAAGVLTTTNEGVLRHVTVGKKQDNSVVIADHYFEYEELATLVVGRELPPELSRAVRGGNNGSPIILGH